MEDKRDSLNSYATLRQALTEIQNSLLELKKLRLWLILCTVSKYRLALASPGYAAEMRDFLGSSLFLQEQRDTYNDAAHHPRFKELLALIGPSLCPVLQGSYKAYSLSANSTELPSGKKATLPEAEWKAFCDKFETLTAGKGGSNEKSLSYFIRQLVVQKTLPIFVDEVANEIYRIVTAPPAELIKTDETPISFQRDFYPIAYLKTPLCWAEEKDVTKVSALEEGRRTYDYTTTPYYWTPVHYLRNNNTLHSFKISSTLTLHHLTPRRKDELAFGYIDLLTGMLDKPNTLGAFINCHAPRSSAEWENLKNEDRINQLSSKKISSSYQKELKEKEFKSYINSQFYEHKHSIIQKNILAALEYSFPTAPPQSLVTQLCHASLTLDHIYLEVSPDAPTEIRNSAAQLTAALTLFHYFCDKGPLSQAQLQKHEHAQVVNLIQEINLIDQRKNAKTKEQAEQEIGLPLFDQAYTQAMEAYEALLEKAELDKNKTHLLEDKKEKWSVPACQTIREYLHKLQAENNKEAPSKLEIYQKLADLIDFHQEESNQFSLPGLIAIVFRCVSALTNGMLWEQRGLTSGKDGGKAVRTIRKLLENLVPIVEQQAAVRREKGGRWWGDLSSWTSHLKLSQFSGKTPQAMNANVQVTEKDSVFDLDDSDPSRGKSPAKP